MMRCFFAAIVFLAAGLAAGGAYAQTGGSTAEAPGWTLKPAAGAIINFLQNDRAKVRQKILRVEGDDVWSEYRTDGGDPAQDNDSISYRSIFTWQIYLHRAGLVRYDFNRAELARLWPLRAGNHVAIRARQLFGRGTSIQEAEANLRHVYDVNFRFVVLGLEELAKPAGPIKAWAFHRVEERRLPVGKLVDVVVRRYWIAEAFGWVVKADNDKRAADASKNALSSLLATQIILPPDVPRP